MGSDAESATLTKLQFCGLCGNVKTEDEMRSTNRCRLCFTKQSALRDKARRKRRIENRLCVKCGNLLTIKNKTECNHCAKKQLVYAKNRRYHNKIRAIELKGGKCIDCGYVEMIPSVFEFHHLDSTLKELEIADYLRCNKQWEMVLKELEKCVLLCCRCHRVRHHYLKLDTEIARESALYRGL